MMKNTANKKWKTLGAPFMALALLVACDNAPPSTLADAQSAFANNSYSTARIHLLNLLEQDGSDIDANILYARTLLALGDGIAAQGVLNTLQTADGDKVVYIAMQAHAEILRGQSEKAINRLEAVAMDDWDAQMFRMAIWAHLENKTLLERPDLAATALERHPENADIHAQVARIGVAFGDWDVAKKGAAKALENDPDNYEAMLVKAETEINDGALEDARASYAKLTTLYPDQGVPPTNVAGLDIDMGNFDAAEQVISKAEDKHPNYPFLQYQKARLAFARENPRTAYDILQAMPDYVHNYPPALALNADAALALGNKEVAIARLERLLNLVPDDEIVRSALAELRQ
jgi:tetratricopeptide (TPR) repeat protein